MADLQGKLAVITGANSGIGKEAAEELARRGCEVVLCCRSVDKAETAKKEILAGSGAQESKVHIAQLDLADLDNIETFRARYETLPGLANRPVDMLILNAGIMALNTRELTKQGLEAQMGTNVVGHFKFAYVMFDLCNLASHCRIVSVSSGAHSMTKHVDFKDFNREKSYAKWQVYAETKFSNLLFMKKLNRLLEEKGYKNITVVGCHPGYSATNLQEHTIFKYANYIFAQSAKKGAEPTVLAATDPSAVPNGYAGPSGMFEAWGSAKWGCKLNPALEDKEQQNALWSKCEEITKCSFTSKM